MVLVAVMPVVSQDKVGREPLLQSLKILLDRSPVIGKEAVPEILDNNFSFPRLLKEEIRALERFFLTLPTRAQDYPVNFQACIFLEPAKNGSSATDFNVVGVGAEAEDLALRVF